MNAVAGGGTFVALPAMIAAGMPSISANASTTVALYPGTFASAYGYRGLIAPVGGVGLRVLLLASLLGGAIGAVLLLVTPASVFNGLVPWLLLLGALAFAFGRQLGERLRGRGGGTSPASLIAAQCVLGIYGGYFGGAVGLMMMAAWSVMGVVADHHVMQATRMVMVGAANSIAAAIFAAAGIVRWPETLVMLVAALVSGYAGARIARRVDACLMRRGVATLNFAMTAMFFWRAYAS